MLVDLLRILCTESLPTYLSFESKNKEFMLSKGLSPDAIKHSMYLLTMCSLAVDTPLLTYEDVANALSVTIDDVETWIVESISSGLIDATIDQSASTVLVRFVDIALKIQTVRLISDFELFRSSKHLRFGPSQWKLLQSKVLNVRLKLENSLESIKKR